MNRGALLRNQEDVGRAIADSVRVAQLVVHVGPGSRQIEDQELGGFDPVQNIEKYMLGAGALVDARGVEAGLLAGKENRLEGLGLLRRVWYSIATNTEPRL